jgi:putative hydrolase of the HAD superfamily
MNDRKLVLVFDLDDTLYDETTYVKSGFKAVASLLQQRFELSEKKTYTDLVRELENGRGHIFDSVLNKYSIFSKKLLHECITVYRFHAPEIKLSNSGKNCLKRFKNYPLYIVTDGNKIVQYNKIKALGLDKIVKDYFITHRFGKIHSKPSPYCFNKISEREKVLSSQVVYIGDNVTKDFVGIKPLGFKTIQVLTGQYTDIKRSQEYQADIKINSLDDLTEDFVLKFFNKENKSK